ITGSSIALTMGSGHGYGYQNGALKMGEKMLLLCCQVFGLLVMYNHLARDIYTNVTLHTHLE
ncbi:hypothetical protein, partial [Serratia marcescens]|uniref:hypothetical protein n=1 Tax=Serratia marcescens TaxID=615 RepID=UPI00195499DB